MSEPIEVPPDSPAHPIGGLGRHRHLLAALAVLLVVGLIVAAGLTRSGLGHQGSARATPPAPFLAPAGTRYVGIGRAVVAVPLDWATSERDCAEPEGASVVFNAWHWRACRTWDYRLRPSVQFLDPADRPHLMALFHRATTNGLEVLRSPVHHPRFSSYAMRYGPPGPAYVRATLASPDLGFMVTIEAATEKTIARIFDSLRELPAGLVVVPPVLYDESGTAVRRLDDSGLSSSVVEAPALYDTGTAVDVLPLVGTPVVSGSEVTLTRSTGPGRQVISNRVLRVSRLIPTAIGGEKPTYPRQRLEARLRTEPDRIVSQVVLKRITVWDYGRDRPAGGLDRFVDHRLVWAVLRLGSPGFVPATCCEFPPTPHLGRSVSLYDAHTGKFLFGQSG